MFVRDSVRCGIYCGSINENRAAEEEAADFKREYLEAYVQVKWIIF